MIQVWKMNLHVLALAPVLDRRLELTPDGNVTPRQSKRLASHVPKRDVNTAVARRVTTGTEPITRLMPRSIKLGTCSTSMASRLSGMKRCLPSRTGNAFYAERLNPAASRMLRASAASKLTMITPAALGTSPVGNVYERCSVHPATTDWVASGTMQTHSAGRQCTWMNTGETRHG